MSDRLKDLQRQRARAQEQLAWIDREIAQETGQAPSTGQPVAIPATAGTFTAIKGAKPYSATRTTANRTSIRNPRRKLPWAAPGSAMVSEIALSGSEPRSPVARRVELISSIAGNISRRDFGAGGGTTTSGSAPRSRAIRRTAAAIEL